MTNEKLKKKIISVLQSVEFVTEKGWCGQCISLRLDYSAIADALITAGIGDVSEYKHRAARAERALQIADELGELCGRKEDYVQQAEKELQEEKKSD